MNLVSRTARLGKSASSLTRKAPEIALNNPERWLPEPITRLDDNKVGFVHLEVVLVAWRSLLLFLLLLQIVLMQQRKVLNCMKGEEIRKHRIDLD